MNTSTKEKRNWHISTWVAPTLIAVIILGVGIIAVLAGLEMNALIVIVVLALCLAMFVLWLPSLHVAIKITVSIILIVLTCVGIRWVIKNDRPILKPQIGGMFTQNFNGTQFGIDVEALIENTGLQSGYADKWQLKLDIDGSKIEGRQVYGQTLPTRAVTEPELYSQEFPPGKPVRGWLFFSFPAVSHDYAAPYFFCNSPLNDKVSVTLSVWDAKTKHEWSQDRSVKAMGEEACVAAQVGQSTIPPKTGPKTQSPMQITPQSSTTDLGEADKLARVYLADHPESEELDSLRKWVNEQLRKEGLPEQTTYIRSPYGYVPTSPQCPYGEAHITNSSAVRGNLGFDISDPCAVLDHDQSIDSKTGFRLTKPQ